MGSVGAESPSSASRNRSGTNSCGLYGPLSSNAIALQADIRAADEIQDTHLPNIGEDDGTHRNVVTFKNIVLGSRASETC